MDRYIGKKLDGRYEILELIGVGGMANVYKAHDIVSDRVVAVKILRDEFAQNEEFLRRFKNESKAIALLSHPNIVKVYDVIFTDKVNSIVMEYIDGITLKEYIEQQKVLSWKEAVHFTVQILRALQKAHDKGIVHRDIKPQNIMLLRDGSIRVMDFGIARFSRSETRTMTDRAIGSVHYISPEQARGDNIDARTDIYSVGVMLFEMLTGQLPFDADSPVTVAIKQIQSVPKKPREINPNIPEGLEAITMRAMEKNVLKRYQSAAEMLRDIDEFKKNPSISFEYKYMTKDTDGEQYSRAIEKKHPRRVEEEEDEEEEKSPIVPIMTGMVTAFVLVTIAFVLFMFISRNPFAPVADVVAPQLIGNAYEEVTNNPLYKNLNIKVIEEDYSDYQEGYIYAQDPDPGRTMKANGTISIKVSKGYKQVKVPGVAGQNAETAKKTLSDLGLIVTESKIYDSRQDEGLAVRTSPEEGESISPGSTIILYISQGQEVKMKQVPNLTGYHLDEAREIIKREGFLVGTITPVASDEPNGTVIGQMPYKDTELAEGSAISLTVSQQEEESSVTIKVELPSNLNREVEMSVLVEDEERLTSTVDLSETSAWFPTVTGSDIQSIQILLDGKLYREYLVDFNLHTYMISVDHSSEF